MRTISCILALIASVPSRLRPDCSPGETASPNAGAVTHAGPAAVIHTSAGNMPCLLFDKDAPIGVANFIGLSNGTKDWTNPVSHAKKHGVPLYDDTIFHRVIPSFMIQGGLAGNGMATLGYKFKNETSPGILSTSRPPGLCKCRTGYEWLAVLSPRFRIPASMADTQSSASAILARRTVEVRPWPIDGGWRGVDLMRVRSLRHPRMGEPASTFGDPA